MARYAREDVDVLVCHADRRRARRHPEQGHGPAGGPGEPAADRAGRRWTRASGDPRRAPALPRVRRLRACRGRPAPAAAGRLLRRAAAGGGGGATGPGGPRVPAARDARPTTSPAATRTPDHVKTHEVSVAAFEAAADPDRYPGSGEPWQPLKLYYFVTFHKARFTALHEEMLRRGLESPYAERLEWWDDRSATAGALEITTRVPCAITSRSGTRHCSRTPPRSTRKFLVRLPGGRRSGRRGRPRTTTWRGQLVELPRSRKTTCCRDPGEGVSL